MYKKIYILLIHIFSILVVTDAYSSGITISDVRCPEYYNFYKTKNFYCIDALVKDISSKVLIELYHNNALIHVGFFAQIFLDYPHQRDRILKMRVTDYTESIIVEALYRANQKQIARQYAVEHDLLWLYSYYEYKNIAYIKHLRPHRIIYEYELLMGAFAASGDQTYIVNALADLNTLTDRQARDVFRLTLLQTRYSSKNDIVGKRVDLSVYFCQKYTCSKRLSGSHSILQILYYSLRLIILSARRDPVIADHLVDFFERNKRLKKIFAHEKLLFGNYAKYMINLKYGISNEHTIKSIISYESFE